MKKYISIVIVLAILVSHFASLTAVRATDKLQITIDDVEAAAGEQVVVNIKLTNNTGIVALLMDLHYGDLEFVKASFPIWDPDDEDMMRSSNNKAEEKRVRLNWISNTTTVTGDVTYATVTFKVPEGAANGTKYELTADIDPDNVFDKDGKNIDFDFVAGEVKVPGEPEVVDTYKCHSLDYVYAGTTKVVSDSDQIDLSSASMKKGSVVTILGWAVFSDNLKEMFYTVDGEEQACENIYRDRTEIAPHIGQPAEYCVHAGFGLDNNLMDLLGTDSLDIGTYEISIGARANGGSEKILKTFTLEVVDESEPDPPAEPKITNTYFVASAITGTSISARGWTGATYPIVKFGYTVDGGEPVWSNVETQTLSEGDDVLLPVNAGKYGIRFAFNINAANLDLAVGTHNFKIVVQLDDDAKTVLPLSEEINTTLNNFVITIEGEAPAAPELIYSYYDELLYDDTQILAGSVDKKVIDPANREKLDFEKGKVSNITVCGWAQLSGDVADIKGFGYSIDGGAVVEGEFVQDRAAELAQAGVAGAQGFLVVVPVSDLEAGEHTIDAYVIAADGTQIKLVKDRSTADAQVINPIGVTFTVTEPEQPTEPAIDSINAGPALLITAEQLASADSTLNGVSVELSSEGDVAFAKFTASNLDPHLYIKPDVKTDTANHFAAVKYRTTSAAATIDAYMAAREPHTVFSNIEADGNWHIAYGDLEQSGANWTGTFVRLDPLNNGGLKEDDTIDIAWIALFASEDDAKAYTGPVQFVNTNFHNGTVENNTHVTADGWTGGNYPITRFGYIVDGGAPVFAGVSLTELADSDPVKDPQNGGKYGVRFSAYFGLKDTGLAPGKHTVQIVAEFADNAKTVLPLGNVASVVQNSFVVIIEGETPVTLHTKSFNIVYVDGIQVCAVDDAKDWLAENPVTGDIHSIGAWGWVWIDNGTISSFGYRIDDNEPVFNTAFIWNRPDVHDTLGLTADVANGYQIDPIDVSNLPDGVYNVTLLVKTADETVLEIETFPITITDRQLAFVQSQSINTLWIDGEMIDGIGQTYITNNPITGDLKNLGVRGWAWIGDGTIYQFGYKLDNGVEIFNDSFIQDRPDVQNVFGVTADVANGYSINPIDVSQLENGSHTVTVLVRTASGTVIEVVTVPFSIERPEESPYDPELSVAGCNLSFESSIYIKYAVKCNDLSKVKLLIWTEPQTQYEYGSQKYILEAVGTEKVSGVKCAIFQYDKLAAKQMGDVIYARAVVENEGEYYYSNLKKYSVLQYVYNKTGRTGTASSNQKLIDLLNAMLDYGAKAQIYFNYKTDRLVTSDYYQVSAVGGLLPDGCTSGLYALGETLTLTAPSVNENGDAFSYWENDAGEVVGTTESITVTVVSLNRTYTAMYGAQIPDEPSEPEYSSGLAYSDNGDGTCTITGIGTCTDTVVDIPPEINGLTVNAIGEKAFENQTSLTGINLPDTIKTIGRRAFYGCTGLTEFTIPNSVTSIGTQIFYKADNIETVYYNSNYYPSTETENQFLNNSSIKKIIFGGTYIGSYAARNLGFAGNVNTVEISNSVWSIGGSAFEGCTSMTSISIPDSVTRIGSDAFRDCTSLVSITIPNSIKGIESYTFSGCASLTNITIPGSVTSIGYYAFESCISLTDVYYSGDLEEWLGISFGYYSSNPCCYGANLYIDGELLTDAIIPDSVTAICGYAFYGCTGLTSITIPDSVTGIGEQAFYGCTSLANITIPDSVTGIGIAAFGGCTSLTSVTISNSVTSIGNSAFSGCASLTSITIPDSVTSIGGYTFYGCTGLTSITIPDNVTSVVDYTFYGCTSLTSVTIPDRVTSIGDSAFYGCTSLTSITIPDGVTSIGGSAFYGCTSLMGITIPDSVTSIGGYAFYDCTSLTSITIPDSVTIIRGFAFSGCTSLTSITIPSSVTSIEEYAFQNCTRLTDVYYTGTSEQWNSITISFNHYLTNAALHCLGDE